VFLLITFFKGAFTFKKSFSADYFQKVHLHHFSKIKSQKEVTKQKKSRFFSLFSLMKEDPDPFI
jgi:hypothetical protein